MHEDVHYNRILVVDDEADVRHFVALVLDSAGYKVDQAADGEEALAKIQASPPDLVVLDLMMPGIDGWGVLEKLSEKGAPPPVVVILSAVADVKRALKAGAHGCVSKPFNVADLLATCTRAILASRGH